MKILGSIFAVLVGFIVIFILSLGTDTILENAGIFPSIAEQQKYSFNILWMDLLALFYRVVYTILGGYITAKLAPNKPMRHVIILGVFGTVVAIVGNIVGSMIPATKDVLPLWFMVALVLMQYPGVWIGGKLAIKQIKSK